MTELGMMTITDHVKELRKRIILVLAVVFINMIAGLFIAPEILSYLKSRPPASEIALNVFSPWDSAKIYVSVALVFSLTVTLPFILYQIWGFVRKGLEPGEQDATFIYIPFALLSFICGLCFSYFVVFPMSLTFTSKIASNLNFVQTIGVAQYFSFMFNIVVPVSLTFELPIIVMFLTKLGILTPKRLHALRRQAYLTLVVTACLISPPELFSHLMVFIPLVLLFEISILLSGIVYRRNGFSQRNAENVS
ncbi:MAG: Sec-independent protein translocase, TatC subunit [Paenibacillus sp.]|nr:Sec-independent protein translocase, TatC subunit [Paenibacillus sp.]